MSVKRMSKGVKLTLPGETAKHAIGEGGGAIAPPAVSAPPTKAVKMTMGPRGRDASPSAPTPAPAAPEAPVNPKPPLVARKALDPSEAQFREESRKLRARAGKGRRRPFGRKGMMHAFGKGGESATGGVRSRDGAVGTISGAAVGRTLREAQHPVGKDVTRFGITTVASKPSKISHQERERLRAKRMDRMAGKSLKVMSIADYHAQLVKADAPAGGGGAPAPGTGAPKRFPRKEKPTIKMKPISDQEAMANLKAGKYHEKSFVMLQAIKALVAGRGKAGSLRGMTLDDLQRAVPPPAPGSASRPYLPGVHPVSAKPKSKDAGRFMGMPPKKDKKAPEMTAKGDCCSDCGDASSMEPDLKKEKTAKSLGESMVADGWQPVIHKSEGDLSMSKTNYNDLFKSELGIANDEPLIDCPHCEAPITKSDLSKASLAKQAGPGAMHGGDGRGQVKGPRGVPGAQKTDAVVGIQNNKGSKTKKSDAESVDVEKGEETVATPPQRKGGEPVHKSIVGVRGTDFVQYVDYGDAPGGDAFIAKSIAEAQGAIGQQATQPMDLNNDLSRLLV